MKIHTLDLDYQGVPNTIAAYLIEAPDGPVLVETGPGSTLPTLLQRLADIGVDPAEIGHAFLTHIHFDHGGAAGWWAQQGTTIHVHGRGAPHLIDPSRLISSATRIYGDMMDQLWGAILPAPADKVHVVEDGATIDAAGLSITAIETPGHAGHHHAYRLGDIGFTGDAAGICLPGSTLVDLPAPPPEFNLELWLRSLDKIRAEAFTTIYPTHFGSVEDVDRQLDGVELRLKEATSFIRERLERGLTRDTIVAQWSDWKRQQADGRQLTAAQRHRYTTANPQAMSVDGIIRYWQKKGLRA